MNCDVAFNGVFTLIVLNYVAITSVTKRWPLIAFPPISVCLFGTCSDEEEKGEMSGSLVDQVEHVLSQL